MDALLLAELGKKYTHTVAQIKFKKTGEIRTVYFDVIGNEISNPVCIIYYNAGTFDYQNQIRGEVDTHSEKLSLRDFDILPVPSRKVFDFKGKTLVFARYPNRQWRKGLVSENTAIIDKVAEMYANNIPNRRDFNINEERNRDLFGFKTLFNLFRDCYAKTLDNALSDIRTYGLVSRAINDKYWISSYITEEKPYLLYRYDVPIAYYNDKIDTLTCLSKVYFQEVTDFCNRLQIETKVEV